MLIVSNNDQFNERLNFLMDFLNFFLTRNGAVSGMVQYFSTCIYLYSSLAKLTLGLMFTGVFCLLVRNYLSMWLYPVMGKS